MNLASEYNNASCSSDAENRLRIEIVRTIGNLESKSVAWNELALKAPQQLPMLSHAWVASYFEHRLAARESWFCIFAYDDDNLVGVLPVVIQPHRVLGVSRPRLKTPNDWHTMSVDFLVANGREKDVIPALLASLAREVPQRFCLKLCRLPEVSPTLTTLKAGHKDALVLQEFDGLGSFILLEGDFEQFQAALGTKFKRNLRYLTRSLRKLPGVETSLLKGTSEVDHLDSFTKVEVSGRKGLDGAISLEPSLVSFYRALVCRLADQGWLYWHILKAEGEDIALNLLIKMGQLFIVFKMCYDEAYSKYSPGSILINSLVQGACSSGSIHEINFLTDLPWNEKWRMKKRRYYNLYLFPRRSLPFLFGYAPKRAQIFLRTVPGFLPLYHGLRRLLGKAH